MTNFLDGDHWRTAQITEELNRAAEELRTLQFIQLLKPTLSVKDNKYCYSLGEYPNIYVQGVGDTAWRAAVDFHNNYISHKIQ
jgi:hypothetical protein